MKQIDSFLASDWTTNDPFNFRMMPDSHTMSGLTTPHNDMARNAPSAINSHQSVVTPPHAHDRRSNYSRVYSPGQQQPYVEWLQRKQQEDDYEVTQHQASMIQKYSAVDRFFASPRAGYNTPFSPPAVQTKGLQDNGGNFATFNHAALDVMSVGSHQFN
jgi:hypothetical protein